jgi:hypothetical protein
MSGDKSNKYATFVTLPIDLRIKYYTMYFTLAKNKTNTLAKNKTNTLAKNKTNTLAKNKTNTLAKNKTNTLMYKLILFN